MTIEVYGVGVCCASACVPTGMAQEDVEDAVTKYIDDAAGSEGPPWKISEDSHFATGETNPCPCNQHAERTHWLLTC